MKHVAKIVFAGAMAFATLSFADATDPTVIARQDVMKMIGKNTKVLGDMAGGKTAFDATAAEAAKAALVAAAAEIPVKFEPQATDPDSEAKPEIWTNWDDFVAKGNALAKAAGSINVSSVETIGAGMGAIGGACKDCHTTYRAMK